MAALSLSLTLTLTAVARVRVRVTELRVLLNNNVSTTLLGLSSTVIFQMKYCQGCKLIFYMFQVSGFCFEGLYFRTVVMYLHVLFYWDWKGEGGWLKYKAVGDIKYYAIGKALEDTTLYFRDRESLCSAASKCGVRVKED